MASTRLWLDVATARNDTHTNKQQHQEEEDWFKSLLNGNEDTGDGKRQQHDDGTSGGDDCGRMVRGLRVCENVKGRATRERERRNGMEETVCD